MQRFEMLSAKWRASHLTRGLAVAGALIAAAPSALAAECLGEDAAELVTGCSVRLDNADFEVRLHAPPDADLTTPAGIASALDRVMIFVHGYAVTQPTLPALRFEDDRDGVAELLLDSGISVLAMAPGDDPEDTVEQDAAALRRAIELFLAHRDGGGFEGVVFGHSMGGLLARIALAGMEADAAPHDAGLYISYDSPHRGVNVPSGMQQLKSKLDEWAAMTEEDFVAIDPGWEGVFDLAGIFGITTTLDPDEIEGIPSPTSVQAQQMTIQGVTMPEAYPALMATLDGVGFPQVRRIAISNGNTQGVGTTQTIGAGDELFFFTGAKGNSIASVRGTFRVFTDLPGAPCFLSNIFYDGFFQNHDGGDRNADTPPGTVAMDHLSGGTIDYAAEMLEAATAAQADFHEPEFRAAADSPIPFVPTSSAFALPVGTADADLADIVASGSTPFDVVLATGDLEAFGSNIDHNTIVVHDSVLDEIVDRLTCAGGVPVTPSDLDGDEVDDLCDDDDDGDGVLDEADNCPRLADADQSDLDADGLGDPCDDDDDGDGVLDDQDNCPRLPNPDQTDADVDGLGDACDDAVAEPGPASVGCACASPGAGPASAAVGLWAVLLGIVRRRRLG